MDPKARKALVAAVEAAYRLDGSTEVWIDRVMRAVTPALDRGAGICAATFEINSTGRLEHTSPMLGDWAPDLMEGAAQLNMSLSPEEVAFSFAQGRVLEAASATYDAGMGPGAFDRWAGFDHFRAHGCMDTVALKGLDPGQQGFLVCAVARDRAVLKDGNDPAWRQVVTHVLAGLRLHARVHEAAEAILEPNGRVVHCEAPAEGTESRDALRAAAVAVDRSRVEAHRGHFDEALETWQGLVDGRWSLVDRFDSDGRRFLLARRNPPEARGQAKLTPRQKQVTAYALLGLSTQETAYALGLKETTVSTHLGAALKTLGVSKRAELVHLFDALLKPESA